MIFPDEKTIEKLATLTDEDGTEYVDSAVVQVFHAAINHIKSAASEEARKQENYLQSKSIINRGINLTEDEKWLIKDTHENAVISTAAKYEEKLRENNREIDARLDKAYMAGFEVLKPTVEKLQAENEQLKAAAGECLGAMMALNQEIPTAFVQGLINKHADLLTKINKGG